MTYRVFISYAHEVLSLGRHGRVRHRGGHSVFSVPENPLGSRAWKERDQGRLRTPFQNERLREERLALGEHAAVEGCSLILNLSGTFSDYPPSVRRSRLGVLRSYLAAADDAKTRVAIDNTIPHGENQLLVGDWFTAMATSSVQGVGYLQTIISRHAPTMLQRVEAFDETLNDLLEQAGTPPELSRAAAVAAIDQLVAELPKDT